MATIRIETDQPIASITINFVNGAVSPQVDVETSSHSGYPNGSGSRLFPDDGPTQRQPQSHVPINPAAGEKGGWHDKEDSDLEDLVGQVLDVPETGEAVDLESRNLDLADLDLNNLVSGRAAEGMKIEIPETKDRPRMVDGGMSTESL